MNHRIKEYKKINLLDWIWITCALFAKLQLDVIYSLHKSKFASSLFFVTDHGVLAEVSDPTLDSYICQVFFSKETVTVDFTIWFLCVYFVYANDTLWV